MGLVSYGPLYLIWNRYHIVLTHVHMVPQHVKCLHVLYDSYGSPIPYMIQVLYGPPNMYVWSPHVLYDSYGPPYFIWNKYLMVPLPYMEQASYCPPTCEVSSCLI